MDNLRPSTNARVHTTSHAPHIFQRRSRPSTPAYPAQRAARQSQGIAALGRASQSNVTSLKARIDSLKRAMVARELDHAAEMKWMEQDANPAVLRRLKSTKEEMGRLKSQLVASNDRIEALTSQNLELRRRVTELSEFRREEDESVGAESDASREGEAAVDESDVGYESVIGGADVYDDDDVGRLAVDPRVNELALRVEKLRGMLATCMEKLSHQEAAQDKERALASEVATQAQAQLRKVRGMLSHQVSIVQASQKRAEEAEWECRWLRQQLSRRDSEVCVCVCGGGGGVARVMIHALDVSCSYFSGSCPP